MASKGEPEGDGAVVNNETHSAANEPEKEVEVLTYSLFGATVDVSVSNSNTDAAQHSARPATSPAPSPVDVTVRRNGLHDSVRPGSVASSRSVYSNQSGGGGRARRAGEGRAAGKARRDLRERSMRHTLKSAAAADLKARSLRGETEGQKETRKPGERWQSPLTATRSRSRLPPRVTEGTHRRKYRYSLATDVETDPYNNDLPGPGAYTLPEQRTKVGVVFNKGNPLSLDQLQQLHRARLPGPGEYNPRPFKATGGKFNLSEPKGELDWVIYFAEQVPGPAEYSPKIPFKTVGGRISKAVPKSDLDWILYRAKEVPDAGVYDPKMDSLSTYHRPPAAHFQGKTSQGNYQTGLQNSITLQLETINDQGPNQCRTDAACAKQPSSMKKSAPAFSFTSSTEAKARARHRMKQGKKAGKTKNLSKSQGSLGEGSLRDGDSMVLGEDSLGGMDERWDHMYKHFGYSADHAPPASKPVFHTSPMRTKLLREAQAAMRESENRSSKTKKGSKRSSSSLSNPAYMSASYASLDEEVVKTYVRPNMSLVDYDNPGPGDIDVPVSSLGKQRESGKRSGGAVAFGTSTRLDALKLKVVEDAPY